HYLNRKTIIQSSYVLKNLKKSRVIFKDIPLDIYDDFLEFQRYFESKNEINRRKIYKGYLSVYNFRDVVEQAIEYYKLKDFIEGNNRSSQ
ncbi:aminoglycoside N(3)-acetyltransferase, partial [Lactococcus cremoris]|nr:aminoglycoside N(3)-acetyltransferase [Lactococcus cremoris]MDM7548067.1 aminoglycoside N(3)-acetyltransferase [Lactococcus lactis]MCT0497579.1 aminoglycoside N(3)-acetyltransferase [Lactococcus cremoris]MCT4409157.1 aminoglycoside N(3)-acetyltransferase [Lactococcus cremoris]MCT4416661.1 aminoglycoside N(3)-acetyltransferase [Lactococcus cremoris]